MTRSTQRRALFLIAVVLLITMLVAAGLPRLELQPGMPPPSLQSGQVVASVEAGETPVVVISVNRFAVLLAVLLFLGAVLYWTWQLLRGATWKSVAETIRPLLIAGALLLGFSFLILLLPRSTDTLPVEIMAPSPEPPVTSPLGPVPLPLLWLVGIALFVLAVLVGVWIFTSSRQAEPIERVGLEAGKARQALLTGSDLKDVIVTCYREMSRALKNERGIEREPSMTTGEFETRLEAAGMPHEPIHQLTGLFEAVRYGNRQPSLAEKQEAIQCLEAIVHYSRKAAGMG